MSVSSNYASSSSSSSSSSSWYSSNHDEHEWSHNKEPTAADHGDVLYDIGKSDNVGRFMIAKERCQEDFQTLNICSTGNLRACFQSKLISVSSVLHESLITQLNFQISILTPYYSEQLSLEK